MKDRLLYSFAYHLPIASYHSYTKVWNPKVCMIWPWLPYLSSIGFSPGYLTTDIMLFLRTLVLSLISRHTALIFLPKTHQILSFLYMCLQCILASIWLVNRVMMTEQHKVALGLYVIFFPKQSEPKYREEYNYFRRRENFTFFLSAALRVRTHSKRKQGSCTSILPPSQVHLSLV